MIKCSAVLLPLLLCTACERDEYRFGTHGAPQLCVPTSDVDPDGIKYANVSLKLEPRDGHYPSVPILFRGSLIKSYIPGFYVDPEFRDDPGINGISSSINFLDSGGAHKIGPALRAANLRELWYAQPPCQHRLIEKLRGSALYRAHCSNDDIQVLLLTKDPDLKSPLPDRDTLVAATCSDGNIKYGVHAGHTVHPCRRVFVFDHFMIDYRFLQQNAGFLHAMDDFLRRKIRGWKSACKR